MALSNPKINPIPLDTGEFVGSSANREASLVAAETPPIHQIKFSIFPDLSGTSLILEEKSWKEICADLTNPPEYHSKVSCPLLKLATFGDIRSEQNSLRHNKNLIEIYGIEGDYDAEIVTPEEAVARLEAVGIKSVVYTSPRHRPDKPRWRVLCPLSRPYPPKSREYYVSLLNGALKGILAIESWTLSQANYFGKIKSSYYQCFEVDGNFIDDGLDSYVIPIGKPHAEKKTGDAGIFELGASEEDAELIRQIMTAESYHQPLLILTSRYLGRGISEQNVVKTVQGLMLAVNDRSDRWQDRYDDIPRMVKGAIHKFSKESAQKKFTLIPAHEFANAKAMDWLIKGIVPRAEIGTIYGASGVGKTFFVLDMAASIALGIPWRGLKVKQGRVVYIAAEGAGGFKTRFAAFSKYHKIALENLPISIIDVAPNFLKDDDPQAIADIINAGGHADLIIIDTVSAVTPGANENSSEGMGMLLSHCKQLHQTTGATILLIDHTGKDQSQGLRGWSGKYAAMDFVIEVSRKNEIPVAKTKKLKDGIEGSEYAFKLLRVELGLDDDLAPITSCVVEHLDAVPISQSKKKKPGPWEQCVIDAAKDLCPLSEKGEHKIAVAEVIEAAIQKVVVEQGKKDRRKEYATRAINSASFSGFIAKEGDFVVVNM